MMRRGYNEESDDSDFGAAVAASAHAILSLEETAASQIQIRRANTTKQDPFTPPKGGPIRKASIKDTRSSSSLRPATSFKAEDQIRHKEAPTSSISKADAWEKAHIAKIRKRYEKVRSDIQAWENEKKLREKQKLERKKKHYERKIGRIDDIGFGARAQVEEKQKKEELIVKEKARKMRLSRQTRVTCFCF